VLRIVEAAPRLRASLSNTLDSAVVRGDPTQAEGGVAQPRVNAIEATPPQGIVRVLVTERPDGAEIAVEDTGRGMRQRYFARWNAVLHDARRRHRARRTAREDQRPCNTVASSAMRAKSGAVPSYRDAPASLRGARKVEVRRWQESSWLTTSPACLFTLKEVLVERGHEPVAVASGESALGRLDGVSVVVTDLAMPGMDGLELLAAIRERDAGLPVILLTAHGSEKIAVAAMRAGAYDYARKPFDIDEIAVVIERAIEVQTLRSMHQRVAAERQIGRRIVGDSPAMQKLLEAVRRVSNKDVTVLVSGETGTGKSSSLSPSRGEQARFGPLVRFNCAAIAPELAAPSSSGTPKAPSPVQPQPAVFLRRSARSTSRPRRSG